MAKVYKATDFPQKIPYVILSGDLEEFPDKPRMTLDLFAPGESEDLLPEEEELDPEVLRQSVLEVAREEAEALVQEAYAEGLRRGSEAGLQQFMDSVGCAAQALEAAGAAIAEARTNFLDSLEPQVLELVKLVARRVIQRELRTQDDLILATVRRALGTLSDRQRILVRLNPKDLETVRQHEIMLLEEFTGVEQLDVEADPGISEGGCEVHSDTMEVNARIETLLASVLDELSG